MAHKYLFTALSIAAVLLPSIDGWCRGFGGGGRPGGSGFGESASRRSLEVTAWVGSLRRPTHSSA